MTDIWKMQLQHLTDLHFLIDSGGKITMEIITKTEGNKATMEISGWLDTQTAPQLGRHCPDLMTASQVWYLILQIWSIFHLQAYVR